jgi:enoyl-CoA hydratase/carnithine racemase
MNEKNAAGEPLAVITKPQAHTAILRLNRPEKKNAMSRELTGALRAGWQELAKDQDVWTIILTGTGDAFCAGGDLRANLARARGELNDAPAQPTSDAIQGAGGGYQDVTGAGNKPIIAAINGYAVGGGFGLINACDIRYCSTNARMGPAEVRWSHMLAVPTYVDTLPLGWGFYFALTGQQVDAETAFRIGLVQKVSEREKLIDDSLELAEIINRNGRLIAQHTKEYIWRCMREIAGWNAMQAMHGLYYYHLRQSPDYDEGMAAFVEKRTPNFSGSYYTKENKLPGVP